MDMLYEVLPIEGKGMGCIASGKMKIGTLIMQEIPQFLLPENLKESKPSLKMMITLMDIFKTMSKSDQMKFLKLQNRFKNDEKINIFVTQEKSKNQECSEFLKEAINIYGICKTNTFFNGLSDGVSIEISRINHSCDSNAEIVWRSSEKEAIEIRAVTKIKYEQ